jgi:hypothetical protein
MFPGDPMLAMLQRARAPLGQVVNSTNPAAPAAREIVEHAAAPRERLPQR